MPGKHCFLCLEISHWQDMRSQACAESKVKCNLQQPCSKCSARGRECVFINDPEASRNRKLAKNVVHTAQSLSPTETDSPHSPTALPSLGPSSPCPAFSITAHALGDQSHFVPPQLSDQGHAGPSRGLQGTSKTSDCSSSVCSSHPSPRLEFFEQPQVSKAFNSNFSTLRLEPDDIHDFIPNGVLDPLVDDSFSPSLPRTYTEADLPIWFETAHSGAEYGNNEPNLYNHPLCQPNDQNFVPSLTNLNRNSVTTDKTSFSRHHFSTIMPLQDAASLNLSSAPRIPIPEELSSYCKSFPHNQNPIKNKNKTPSVHIFYRVQCSDSSPSPPNLEDGGCAPPSNLSYASLRCLTCQDAVRYGIYHQNTVIISRYFDRRVCMSKFVFSSDDFVTNFLLFS